jgi:ligand-binding sensor domain-containing protein/signal transduction histidine kinase
MNRWLNMKSFRKWAVLFVILLNACSQTVGSSNSPADLETIGPTRPLWNNSFPPIKYEGTALRFSHYGLEEGLSQSSARVLFQDDLGFLWIGTEDGLNRFDGYSFKVFRPNPNDPDALSGGEIFSMAQDVDSAIWVGTYAGLNRYDPVTSKFSHWVHADNDPDSLISDVVLAIHQDPKGIFWIGTNKGLDQFDPATGKFIHLTLPDNPSEGDNIYSISALYEDQHGILWLGTNHGLIRYEIGGQKSQLYQNQNGDDKSISFDEVSSIVEGQNGMLWIGTHLGLNRLDPATGEFTRFIHSESDPASLGENYIRCVLMDRAGQLWVGTRNGLDRFDPARQRFIHYRNDPADLVSLSDNNIYSIYEDRGGMLWVGTFGGGLNLHDRSQDQFAYYHHVNAEPQSLSGDMVFPILAAPGGKIWVGTYGAGLNLFDPATGQSEQYRRDPKNPDSLLSDTIRSLFLDRDGTLWIGTNLGLDRLNPGSSKFIHYVSNAQDPKSIPFGTVYKIYRDSRSIYWVGTARGVRIFSPTTGEFTRIDVGPTASADLADGPVRVIYEDRSGAIWLAADTHGLFRLDPAAQKLEHYTYDPKVKTGIGSNTLLDLYEDSRGNIWIAAFQGGLNRYLPEENAFEQFRLEQGLPNDVVYGILEDQDGNLWMSTNLGISEFNPVTSSFENFTVKDGLQGNEFNATAFARDEKGRMYFGGIKGLTVFDPAEIKKNSYVPPVVLTSLTFRDGKPVSPVQTGETLREATLSYPQNSFDLSFAALSFSQMDKNQYRYMLEGFDQDWHSAGSDHKGSYTNIPGGSYILQIQGSNSDGTWNEAGVAVKITVIPPFWQTWPFRGLVGMALIAAAFLTYRWRVRSIQTQKMELERIIRERTQVLKKQNLDLEALYSADEKMLRVLTQDEVLQALVDVAVDILQADKSAVFIEASGYGEYLVRVWRGFHPETMGSPDFAGSQQTILRKVAGNEPLIVCDAVNDVEWRQQQGGIVGIMSTENVRSLMYFPIKVQDAVLGVFNVCSSEPGAFDGDRQRLFASLIQRAALSIENSRLFEKNKHLAVVDERNRLAQELHDSAKQKAFAALAQLGAAKKKVVNDHGNAGEHLVEAEKIVSEVIRDLTFLIQESYPRGLKERGLAASVRDYAFAWESRSSIRLNLSILEERRLPPQIEQALYRIIQEGLSNIARHSQATQANVRIAYQEREIQIQVGDNGRGFDLMGTSRGLGLQLIHERLESVGGHVDIQSRPGGTWLNIRVPVQAHK